jgi:integrase/recombinase XerC
MRKRLPVFITERQTEQLFEVLKQDDQFCNVRDVLILEVFYASGIRLTELLNLYVCDLDQANCTLKVLGKRNKERIIPVPRELMVHIMQYLELRDSLFPNPERDLIFLTDTGKPLYARFVYRLVHQALGLVTSMEKRSPHVLRHTFATHLLNNGAPISAIKELLGHANLAATQVYTHNSFEQLKKLYKQAHPRA